MGKVEENIGKIVQGDIPAAKRPFTQIGKEAGLTEDEVINTIRGLIDAKVIRKFGAILRHQKAGYTRNAMVIWFVPEGRVEEAGKALSSFKEVTHCYERRPAFEGKYNVFTMVHSNEANLEKEVEKIAAASGIKDYKVLESLEEFKKSSMEYF